MPWYLPAFLSSTRRKKGAKARSRWRSASCAAHVETAYSQGTAVGLSAFSSRCSSIACRRLPIVRYAACLRCRPSCTPSALLPHAACTRWSARSSGRARPWRHVGCGAYCLCGLRLLNTPWPPRLDGCRTTGGLPPPRAMRGHRLVRVATTSSTHPAPPSWNPAAPCCPWCSNRVVMELKPMRDSRSRSSPPRTPPRASGSTC